MKSHLQFFKIVRNSEKEIEFNCSLQPLGPKLSKQKLLTTPGPKIRGNEKKSQAYFWHLQEFYYQKLLEWISADTGAVTEAKIHHQLASGSQLSVTGT